MQRGPSLPLGAVRADDGSVVVPESRRADGSVRKPIRIRQGYVPQDEVPKYKPVGQRLREQQAKEQQQHRSGTAQDRVSAGATPRDNGSASGLAADLGTLSLDDAPAKKPLQPAPMAGDKRERAVRPQERREVPPPASARSPIQTSSSTKELKSELSALNKSLREISKLEAFDTAFARGDDGSRPLSAPQKRKVERKTQLETRRREIVAALDAGPSRNSDGDAQEEQEQEVKPKTLRVIEL